MRIAFFGSSLVSAYWNGAATYYRGLLQALALRGHDIAFYEPDAYDRQSHRDMEDPPWAKVCVYQPNEGAALQMLEQAKEADLLIKASGVGVLDAFLEQAVLEHRRPGGMAAFWDVDAPATLERLANDPQDPFAALIPQYDLIFTYGGGHRVVSGYQQQGARCCFPIYNGLDPKVHHPVAHQERFACDLVLLANRLPDREARIESFFIEPARLLPARSFRLGGNGWHDKDLPANIMRLGHVYSEDHNALNCSALAVMNVHRDSMIRFGYSPATRLFEAAGAGACLITDAWEGIEDFFEPESEVLVVHDAKEVAEALERLTPKRAYEMGQRALARALANHTYDRRALQVEEAIDAHVRFVAPRIQPAKPLSPLAVDGLDIAIVGLSITSSWGNGHATTYRGLVRALAQQGHRVTFYERDVPWYASNRDQSQPDGATVRLYNDLNELEARWGLEISKTDVVIVGSYVPEGQEAIKRLRKLSPGVFAFYDIDTPVTLEALEADACEYLSRKQIPVFDLYLSFSGGRALELLEGQFGAQRARALYCSFDPDVYRPLPVARRWDLGYMGTYSADRQPPLEELLIQPARALADKKFVVAGPQYPQNIEWPQNVERIDHIAPREHAAFYCASRFTLNVTRSAMRKVGWSPSVRLFEAAGCGVTIISDEWQGLSEVLTPGREILVASGRQDVMEFLHDLSEQEVRDVAAAARARCLAHHTAAARASELVAYIAEAGGRGAVPTLLGSTKEVEA